jgi:hypothetical protein
MQGTILLNFNEDTHEVETVEKERFLHAILEQCFETTDVINQIQEIWGSSDEILTPEQKIKLLNILTPYGVQIINNRGEDLSIYLEKELIGKFNKPRYVLKRDPAQLDRRKQFFLEMHIDCWSLFNEEAT